LENNKLMRNASRALRKPRPILRWGVPLVMSILSACHLLGSSDPVELSRVVSPDSLVDAVVTRDSQNATTAYVYRVYLVPHGVSDMKQGTEQFRADHVEELVLQWTAPKMLLLQFSRARVFHYSNFWNSRDVDSFRHTVELRLVPRSDTSL
jgi:hypothetical protein